MRGLDSIDFSFKGLGALGISQAVTWSDALDIAWSKLPVRAKLPFVGISREAFNAKLTAAARGYDVYRSDEGPPTRTISDSMILSGVSDPDERAVLSEMLSNLHADGYYITSQIQTSGAPQSSSSAPSSPAPSFWDFNTRFVQPFTSTIQTVAAGQPRDINAIVQQRYKAQSDALWKSRLPWIVGIGGLLLVGSLALLASD